MHTAAQPLASWFQAVLALGLSHDVNKNMLVFSASEARAAQIGEPELVEFLCDVFREYCRKAAGLRMRGWFYAWFDEMSGTLRCSFCEAHSAAELPFRCKVHAVDTPAKLAELTLSSPYVAGIPNEELRVVDPFEEDAGERELELTVFARSVMTIA